MSLVLLNDEKTIAEVLLETKTSYIVCYGKNLIKSVAKPMVKRLGKV